MRLFITSKDGKVINTTEDWRKFAPPMNPKQWQEYRSAQELAKSIFDNKTFVPKITSVLERFNIPVPEEMHGIPEKATKLPWGKSGNRKHDLFLKDNNSTIVIGIEAKADEPFDKSVKDKRKIAIKNADGGENMSDRLDGILNYLYNNCPPDNKEDLMYQLLSATAGVILEAKAHNIEQVCVMFLVFNSDKLSQKKKNKNDADWQTFCNTMKLDNNGGVITIQGVKCLIIKEQIELIKI